VGSVVAISCETMAVL